MNNKNRLEICFMGAKQAGIIGALTILAKGKILSAVTYSEDLANILSALKIPLFKSVKDKYFVDKLSSSDLLICVHGREIVKPNLLKLPKFGAINIHPYFRNYKGANPVERAFKDKDFGASVCAHIMEKDIDQGKVLVEEFIDVSGANSVDEIYNKLYPYYCIVILKLLELIYDDYAKP